MSEVEQEIVESTIAESRPDWLPTNFKTGEDFAKSYSEAQSKLTQQAQEIAAIKAQQDEFIASQQSAQSEREYNTIEEQLIEAIEFGDGKQKLAAMAYLVQQAQGQNKPDPPQSNNSEVLAFAADQSLAAKYEDWNEVKMDIGKLVEQDPGLLQVDNTTPLATVVQRLERVYKIAKADRVLSQGESIVQVEQEAHRQGKQQAQTITGASQRPATSTAEEDYWQSIKETPVGGVRVGRF